MEPVRLLFVPQADPGNAFCPQVQGYLYNSFVLPQGSYCVLSDIRSFLALWLLLLSLFSHELNRVRRHTAGSKRVFVVRE